MTDELSNVNGIYGKKYCARNEVKAWRFKVAPVIARVLTDFFKPETSIDFGAANGLYAMEMRKLGVNTFGLEGTLAFRPYLKKRLKNHFAIIDFRQKFDLNKQVDLVTCVEVLEHIERSKAATAIKNIIRHTKPGGHIVLSTTDLGGHSHINKMPQSWWLDKILVNKNLEHLPEKTQELQGLFKYEKISSAIWYRERLMIFRKKMEAQK